MRKRFQMLVCAAAFTAAAGLCTLPLTAFAADAAVLLPDESASAAFDQSGGLLAGGSSTTATLTLSGVWTPAEWGTAVPVGTATVTVGAVQSTPAGNTAPSETTGTEPTGTEESDLS